MKIAFASHALPKSGAAVVAVLEERRLSPSAAELDKLTGGALKRAMQASRFKGKASELLEVLAPKGVDNSRVLLVGLGKPADLGARELENAGGEALAKLNALGESEATVVVDDIEGAELKASECAARLAYGARLRAYRFDRYKTKEKPEDKPSLKSFTVAVGQRAAAKRAYDVLDKVADGVCFTRDLVSEPANELYPQTLAKRAQSLSKLGVEVEVLDEKALKRLGMGALLAVGQGSERPPRVVVMRWNGGRGKKVPIAFVGKGVTFDTGGISIKPSADMHDMKWDMGGAGVVIGLMRALAGRKAKVNAVGVIGLVENMPSGKAYRPGDIVKSLSGQTIEVLNTDAEGRLVLADCLWHAQEAYKPETVVNLATLTGAIIIALGHQTAGLFANDDELAEHLTAAGKAVGEPVWRLPMSEEYDKAIDCDAADMKNIGEGRAAGSITAAQFLQRYIKDGTKWAHIDIAGVTWSKKDKPTVPKGGTGFGVRLLDRLVQEHYE